MKKFLALFLLFSWAKIPAATYTIEHMGDMVHVVANFKAAELRFVSNNKIHLRIPQIGHDADFSKQISNITTNGIFNLKNRTVTLRKGDDLRIEYDIFNLSLNEFKKTFPIKPYHFISYNKFYLLGYGLFIRPSLSLGKCQIDVKSSIKEVAYNIYPYFYPNHSLHTDLVSLDGIVIMGSQDLIYSKQRNFDMIMLSYNSGLLKKFQDIAIPAFEEQEKFWGAEQKNRKLSIIIPAPVKGLSFVYSHDAYHYYNTSVFFIVPETISRRRLNHVFKHENLHFWFGHDLLYGPRWFIEGFNEYYLNKIDLYFSKNKRKFIYNYNAKVFDFLTSPIRKWNDKEVDQHFYADMKDMIRLSLPYYKGAVIAGQIDSMIDLDNALKKMMKLCKKNKRYCEFTPKNLFNCAGNVPQETQDAIKKLFISLDDISFNSNLCEGTKLSFRKVRVADFAIDIKPFIKKNYILGNDLKGVSDVDILTKYDLLDPVIKFNTGKIKFTLKDQNVHKTIVLEPIMKEIDMPFYEVSN